MTRSDRRGVECPTCGQLVEIVVWDHCRGCGDREIVAWIDRLDTAVSQKD